MFRTGSDTISFHSALTYCVDNLLPDPSIYPGKFIQDSEPLIDLIAEIYGYSAEYVCEELKEAAGIENED